MGRSSSSDRSWGREGTYRLIVTTLRDNPAYLLMFGVGLLGGAVGLGTAAVGLWNRDPMALAVAATTWIVLLVSSVFVIRLVESRREGPSMFLTTIDQAARAAFLAGGSAERLHGRWKVAWYEGEGPNRRPYDPDPQEEITVTTLKCRVTCSGYDPSRKRTYWIDGRLSCNGMLTAIYWSQSTEERLVGSLFLRVDDRLDGVRMKGWWRGHTRDDSVRAGEVEWTRLG